MTILAIAACDRSPPAASRGDRPPAPVVASGQPPVTPAPATSRPVAPAGASVDEAAAQPAPPEVRSPPPDRRGAEDVPTASHAPCVFDDITLHAMLSDCPGQPRAAEPRSRGDVGVSLVAADPHVAPGKATVLELRYVNRTAGLLRLRLDRGLHLAVNTVGPAGAQIEPPPGSPRFLPDPSCLPTTCPTMAAGAVVLAPGGVARVPVPWVAERKAWPPPARLPCCTVAPGPIVGAGPLAPGRYKVSVAGPLLTDVAAADVAIDVGR